MAEGKVIIGAEIDTKKFDKQISKLEKELEALESEKRVTPIDSKEYEDIEAKIESINNKLIDLNEKKKKISEPTMKNMFKGVESGLSKTLKSMSRWLLAIFSIRSAYTLIRNAMSTLTQYNTELAAKIEGIKIFMASALEPIITRIVNLVFTLISYIDYLAQAWFGVSISAKASTMALKSGAKAARDMKKSLAGFDEVTRLEDTTSSGGGAGGVMPNIPTIEDVKIPSWLEWIKNNGPLIKTILEGIAIAIAALKLAELLQTLGFFTNLPLWQLVAGLGLILTGIIALIIDIIAFIKDPSWSNFGKILESISIILAGIAVLTGQWIPALIALGTAIAGVSLHLLGEEDSLKRVEKATNDLADAENRYEDANNNFIRAVDNAEEAERKLEEAEKKHKISGKDLQDQVNNGRLTYMDMNKEQREVYKAYVENIAAQDNLTQSAVDLGKATEEVKDKTYDLDLTTAEANGTIEEFRDTIIDAWTTGKVETTDAQKIISKAMAGMSDDARKTFSQNIPNDIKNGLNPDKYETAKQKFVNWWNNNLIGNLIKDITIQVGVQTVGGMLPIGNANGAIYYPKLAAGGIINQPGRGIPLGRAIGGEAGAEGVIPLTDSQAMETLGEAIGRYITINANIVNSMNGRVLSRELRTIQGNQDFAYNR